MPRKILPEPVTKPIQHKTSLVFLLTAGAAAVDSMLHHVMPEARFGIVIYHEDDFESNTVTYLLYRDTPENLYITFNVQHRSLATVLKIMAIFNPHVSFQPVWHSSSNMDKSNHGLIVYELLVISKVMKVNDQGFLVEHSIA